MTHASRSFAWKNKIDLSREWILFDSKMMTVGEVAIATADKLEKLPAHPAPWAEAERQRLIKRLRNLGVRKKATKSAYNRLVQVMYDIADEQKYCWVETN